MMSNRTSLARKLRAEATDVERLLWRRLSRNQLGTKFRRQFPLGPYILDFVSIESRIDVEVDGGQHQDAAADAERDKFVQSQGFTVLRFWNNDVIDNVDGVLNTIARCIRSHNPVPVSGQIKSSSNLLTPPLPSPAGGEGVKPT